jgi:hypothetical protein
MKHRRSISKAALAEIPDTVRCSRPNIPEACLSLESSDHADSPVPQSRCGFSTS